MTHKLIPASRLTIIFILAVVISGTILTYFSINNISNLKELTEKRILEEQRELSARFSASLQNKISKVTDGLINTIGQSGLTKDSLIKKTEDHDFIIQAFILNNNGQFLYPNFPGIFENSSAGKPSKRFISDFSAGEKAEFTDKNPGKAKDYYLSCLNYSTGSSDSVKALNALGRISLKLDAVEDAIASYSDIISDYSQATDGNGFPYVYYALPQLLKIAKTDKPGKILPAIENCLEKMEAGFIPLNYNTGELLTLVSDWINENNFDTGANSSGIGNLIDSIKLQVRFINIYGNELSALAKKENPDNHFPGGNDFKVFNSGSGTSQEFFLINTNFRDPAGFLIDRKKLFDAVLKTDLQSGLEFDYKIELPDLGNTSLTRDNLIYSSQLNPLFPNQLIEIKPGDENLIKDLIRRRSWIYGVASVLLLLSMCLGVVLILRDIAREKFLTRLRSDFISNVTHELKTPLTSIRMYAESLLMGRIKTASGQKEYLSVVVNESDRLKRMINNILEFSKMEKGKPEYHFVNTNLASIVNAALIEMNYWFEKEEFEIISVLDENINAEIDPDKMKQVVENLLSNAIKYSTGTKKIFIRLFKETDHICIEIEDRGIGISADKIPRIFEPFYRIEQKESISGTGLGLTVVKEIVEAHNGKISVTSEPGKGSKFVIILNQEADKSENNPGN